MEETNDGRILPTESSPPESVISNSEISVTSATDEKDPAQNNSMKAKYSAILDVQNSSDDLSLDQSTYIPEGGSGEIGIRAESDVTSLSDVKVPESPHLDGLKMDMQNFSNKPENGTSAGISHIGKSNDDIAVSNEIKLLDGSKKKGTKMESVESSLTEMNDKETPNSLDVETPLSEAKDAESSHSDSLKIEVQTVSSELENVSTGVSHAGNNDDVAVSNKIESVDGSDEKRTGVKSSESSFSELIDKEETNPLDVTNIEVETVTSKLGKIVASSGTDDKNNEHFDVPSEAKPSHNTSEPLSSHELSHSEIEVIASKEYPVPTSLIKEGSFVPPDGPTDKTPVVEQITSPLKAECTNPSDRSEIDNKSVSGIPVDKTDVPGNDEGSSEIVEKSVSDSPVDKTNVPGNAEGSSEIVKKSASGSPVDKTDVPCNDEDNASSEIGSCEHARWSLTSDELGNEIEGDTPTKSVASTKSSMQVSTAKINHGLVDTAAPFESVKEAVTKFGGIVDWKAHKSKTLERQKFIHDELEMTKEEIPRYKQQTEAAEHAKDQVLEELERTKRLIEELKLSLEKAQTEEAQAMQDSELAQLRVREIEQGIAGEASVAAKEQLNVAKTRHASAVAELKSVKDELKTIHEEYISLVSERDLAITRAEVVISASKDMEKTVEDLTLELIAAREALESAHTAHMEAEEHRIGAALARDQDSLNWDKELKQAEYELQILNEKISSAKDLQSKLDSASSLLLNLKGELAAYMEAKLNQECESISEENEEGKPAEVKETHASMLSEVASTKEELKEVNGKIEKARKEVDILNVAILSLKTELEVERAALATMKQREGMASVAVSALEVELDKTNTETEQVHMREKEVREKMVELPKALAEAAREADEAKMLAQLAQEELKKAKEESEQAKASVSTMESRLHATLKEIEATRASEKLALAAIKALQESEQASEPNLDDSQNGVTLPLEEYHALSKRAHDAEEQAGERVTAAISQIEVAKESEERSLKNLELANKEMAERKETLRLALERAEKAKEGKLAVEQELRAWRAENERRRKAAVAPQVAPMHPPRRSFEDSKEPMVHVAGQEAAPVDYTHSITAPSEASMNVNRSNKDDGTHEVKTKKKRFLFPKIAMLLARKRASGT